MKGDERAVLICTDLKSFYPTIDRSRLRKLIKRQAKSDLEPMIDRLFGEYEVDISAGCEEMPSAFDRRELGSGVKVSERHWDASRLAGLETSVTGGKAPKGAVPSIHMCIKVCERSRKIAGRTVYYPGMERRVSSDIKSAAAAILASDRDDETSDPAVLTPINAD